MVEALIRGTVVYTEGGARPTSFPRAVRRCDSVSLGGRLFVRLEPRRGTERAFDAARREARANVHGIERVGGADVFVCLCE